MVSFDITSLLTLNIIKDYVNNDDQFNRKTVTYMKNFFHHIINLHQNIEFIIEEESKGRLAFLDTLLKRNNGYGIGMHWYVGTLRTLVQYLYYSFHYQKCYQERLFLIV